MSWWVWIVVGLLLSAAELLTPGGLVLIFFGAASLAVGVLTWLGLGGPVWFQWLLFSLSAAAALLLFRNPLLRRLRARPGEGPAVDSLLGELAVPVGIIPAGAVGQAELRGTVWMARNVGAAEVARGQRCRVEKLDGLMISIRPEGRS